VDTTDTTDTTDTGGGKLDTRAVALVLGVSGRTVTRFADRGVLPAERLTPRSPRRYRAADVLAVLERRCAR
jgi:DNA-binding transcriptional MerR regulator